MNQLEGTILKGARNAHHRYREISGGLWLWHAPESFIMAWLASYVEKKYKCDVYLDCSVKKIHKEIDRPKRGRPVRHQVRYDLVIWRKSRTDVRAIIEIKKAFTAATLKGDTKKLRKYRPVRRRQGRPPLKQKRPWAAYLLVYTESPDKNRGERNHKERLEFLTQRGTAWAKEFRLQLVSTEFSGNHLDDDNHDWAFYLFYLRQRRKYRRRRPH